MEEIEEAAVVASAIVVAVDSVAATVVASVAVAVIVAASAVVAVVVVAVAVVAVAAASVLEPRFLLNLIPDSPESSSPEARMISSSLRTPLPESPSTTKREFQLK